ncbi:transposase [Escherichia coli]|nr:transposase [Escherichia coli]
MERVPLKQTDRHHKSPGGDLCIRDRADRGLVQSMSRKGNCLDNAVMENFFGHLKEEMYYRRDYRSVEELENAVNEYITYWNQKRIKLSLGGLSPVEYRTEYQKAG